MSDVPREDSVGTLRATQAMMLQSRTSLQSLARGGADLIDKIQNTNPTAYQQVLPVLEKIRTYPRAVVRNIVPITTGALLNEYNTKNKNQVASSIADLAQTLRDPDTQDTLHKIEDFLFKSLSTNANFRSGVEDLMNGFFAPSLLTDRSLKDGLIDLIYEIGEMMFKKAGFLDQKSPQTSMKELIINVENFFTTSSGGGDTNQFDTNAAYSAPGGTLHSSDFRVTLRDLFSVIKSLVVPAGNVTTNLLEQTSLNAYNLDFLRDPTNVNQSLRDLLHLDGDGLHRQNDIASRPISALESLFLVLTLADNYGYRWNPGDTGNNYLSNSGGNGSYMTGGELTLGDAIFSMGSIIGSSDSFNFKNITELSRTSNKVFRETATSAAPHRYKIGFNTRVLSILEDQSRGETASVTDPGSPGAFSGEASFDPVYAKTIPWILDWIVKVTLEGYGPYYNVNRRNISGDFLSPSGAIARFSNLAENKYVASWKTDRYWIEINPNSVSHLVYLGGYADPVLGTTPDAGRYTITEITKTDVERAVNSDEEAFYKNLQWLLYEKRFVAALPVRAKLAATVSFEEALFITAIGNGIMGMLGLKPNCATTCADDNGKWTKSGAAIKNYSTPQTDLSTWSNVPGDSVFLLEGWGYGAAGTDPFQVSFVYSALWSLLVPSPDTIYGMIPPVISQNAGVVRQLGFTGTGDVAPSQVNAQWEKRNRLTPFIVTLAKAIGDDAKIPANRTAGRNPYRVLSDLAESLSRPYLFFGEDKTALNPPTTGANIVQLRTIGINSGMRNSEATPLEYKPSKNYRTLISLLVEGVNATSPTPTDRTRLNDGILDLLSKTEILSGLVKFATNLGNPSKADARTLVMSGLTKILTETDLWADCGASTEAQFDTNCPTKFAFDDVIDWLVVKIAEYPDARPANLYDPVWSNIDDLVTTIRDYIARSSGWSLVTSLNFILDMLLDIRPTTAEISSTLNLVSSLFVEPDLTTRTYTITQILSTSLPPVLDAIAPYGRSLYATGYQLAIPGHFFSYLEENSFMAPQYEIKDLLEETKLLLRSDMIQTSLMDQRAFLYSAGTLIGYFGDILERGRKFSGPYYFYDNWNDGQPTSTYWDNLNLLLSVH
ncbi:hypothetical protein [Leptospira perolatii]|uniref:hypothetical protein n=1 Tax=Leptospira perolatii TaxID=2023191 RepID=UPI001FAF7602|nr:hypothetical protein [Leptospira perolatii]